MRSVYFILFIFAGVIFYWIANPYYPTKIVEKQIVEPVKIDSTISITFSAVGDIMCHSTQYYYAWVEKDSFDFRPVFEVIGDYLHKKDITIGNLETVLAGDTKNYAGYPFFNSPNQLADALKYAGFDFLTTANNHANDQGYEGVLRTLEYLRKINIIPLGTNRNDSIYHPGIFIIKGIKVGMIAYTYGTNYNESSLNPERFINHIDYRRIKRDIDNLKSRKAELIIVLYHFGEQYAKIISQYQKSVADRTVEYGADIIIGSHPHVIQKFEEFKTNNGNLDSGFVAYSLGNFVSNQRWRYSDGGIIFNFEITKNLITDSLYISDISYLPVWVFKGKTENGKDYIILPSAEYDSLSKYNYLTKADADSMKKSYFDNINLFTSESDKPKLEKFK